MNNFFNQQAPDTINVNGKNFTAQEIAKIISFGRKTIQWDGAQTWIAPSSIASLMANFCADEGTQEHEKIKNALVANVSTGYPTYGEGYDENVAKVFSEALQIAQDWGAMRLHTCLKKSIVNDDIKKIDLDKLESALGFSFGEEVRARLERVSVEKDDDEWKFTSATGTHWRETATKGVLCEIADAVNLVENITQEVNYYIKRGVTCFDEISRQSHFINVDRMSQEDIDAVKKAVADSGVEPEEYTAFFSNRYDECRIAPANVAEERWAFSYSLGNFPSRVEALEFGKKFNLNYRPQKRRTELELKILDAQDKLADLKNELEKLQ